jgi:hypothetical protein
MEAEYNAVTCVAVYMLLMSFSQKGIDKLRHFQEHLKMKYPDGDFVVSDGFEMGPLLLFLVICICLILLIGLFSSQLV